MRSQEPRVNWAAHEGKAVENADRTMELAGWKAFHAGFRSQDGRALHTPQHFNAELQGALELNVLIWPSEFLKAHVKQLVWFTT